MSMAMDVVMFYGVKLDSKILDVSNEYFDDEDELELIDRKLDRIEASYGNRFHIYYTYGKEPNDAYAYVNGSFVNISSSEIKDLNEIEVKELKDVLNSERDEWKSLLSNIEEVEPGEGIGWKVVVCSEY